MARQGKPYARPSPDGQWGHDAFESLNGRSGSSGLAGRLSAGVGGGGGGRSGTSSPRPGGSGARGGGDLLSRLSGGQGKELLKTPAGSTTGMQGFDRPAPANPNNLNAGLELLPSNTNANSNRRGGATLDEGRLGPMRTASASRVNLTSGLVGSSMAAALGSQNSGSGTGQKRDGKSRPKELFPDRPGARRGESASASAWNEPSAYAQPTTQQSLSVMGHSKASVWVRVDNLAQGTTAEDVVSAFAPAPIQSARSAPTSSPSRDLVCVELELATRAAGEELVKAYDGAMADGNTLKVEILRQGLGERLGGRTGQAHTQAQAPRNDSGMDVDVDVNAGRSAGGARSRELVDNGAGANGRMYSDRISPSNLPVGGASRGDDDLRARQQRASGWNAGVGGGGGGLAARVGRGGW